MKKVFVSILTLVLALTLTGCGSETKTCSIEESGMKMDVKMTAKSDVLKTFEMKVTMGPEIAGMTSFSDLDDSQKDQFKDTYLSLFGVDEDTKGIEVDVDFGDDLILTIEVDLDKTDKETLESFGIDSSDEKYSLKETVEGAEASGYTCK